MAKKKKVDKTEAYDNEELMREVHERYNAARDKERQNQDDGYEALAFLRDQWPQSLRAERENEGRPCMVVDQTQAFLAQVQNDARQMRPSMKLIPVDDEGDEEIAEKRNDILRYAENRSDADYVYYSAFDQAVSCGLGHWKWEIEEGTETTFEKELRISLIEDGLSVLWDVDAVRPTREDALWCFEPFDISRLSFKDKFPKANPDDFNDLGCRSVEWYSGDYIRLARYWKKKKVTRKLVRLGNGAVVRIDDIDDELELEAVKAMAVETFERDGYEICNYLVSGREVLEGPVEFPGSYIPIIPVVGKEFRVGREVVRRGLVWYMMDAQRLVNYYTSADAEITALQPKAPYMVTKKNIDAYMSSWLQANRKNLPFLLYEPDSSNGGAAPQRVPPPVSSQGIINGLEMAYEAMKKVTGIYDAGLGNRSNESSGKAIEARQRESDVGTYNFIDNFNRSIKFSSKVGNQLIPFVYDTARTLRIMGEDGQTKKMEINQGGYEIDGVLTGVINDVTVGSYDVVSSMGPSYTTRREEAKEGMIELLRTMPESGQLIMDLVVKAQDWPMADDIAKRFRTLLPPQIRMIDADEKELQEMQEQGVGQPQQPPPDPEAQAKAAREMQQAEIEAQKSQIEIQMMQVELETKKQLAAIELQIKQQELENKQAQYVMNAHTDHLKNMAASQNASRASEQ